MRRWILILAAALAACGVDGDPERPEGARDLPPGVALSGRIEIGVASRR